MAFTLLHADDFNRADASLSGATMSDGVGVWTAFNGTWAVVSNEAVATGGADPATLVDGSMSAVADQKSSIKSTHHNAYDGHGPLCRWNSAAGGGSYYIAYGINGSVGLYRDDGGATFTQLGSTATGVLADGDILAIEAIGSTITTYVNGSSVISQTDSTFATGKCGVYCGYGAVPFDDFADYVDSGATAVPISDTASGADVPTVAAAIPVADTGSGSDSPSVAVAAPVAEAGTGVESIAISVSLSVADSGACVDTPGVAAAVGVADTGAGTEAVDLALAIAIADAGSAIEALGIDVSVLVSETGHGVEVATVPEAVVPAPCPNLRFTLAADPSFTMGADPVFSEGCPD